MLSLSKYGTIQVSPFDKLRVTGHPAKKSPILPETYLPDIQFIKIHPGHAPCLRAKIFIKESAHRPIRKASDRLRKQRFPAPSRNFTSPNKVPAWRLEKT